MSGPLGSQQWMYASGGFYSFSIDQSLRFNDNDSAYLNRTPASAGNRKTWTWSGWVKRGNLGVTVSLMDALQTSGTDWTRFHFNNSDQLAFAVEISNSNVFQFVTTQVFRDPSAWYHIVAAYDSTQATSTDRFKLYVNGEQVTAFSTETYGAQNTDSHFSAVLEHNIGAVNTGIWFFDGYMAEVNFIDGTALDPTSFGETIGGVWVPKAYSGSYGTNGFYLSFADSSAIGDDLSGNTNDWTANNLVASDVVSDSPTNNFATLNANFPHVSMTFLEGNLKWSTTVNNRGAMGNFSIPIGTGQKYYFEYVQNGWGGSSGDDAYIGLNVDTVDINGTRGGYTTSYSYGANAGNKRIAGSETSYGTAWGTGDVIGIAVDRENNTINFAKNNTFHGTFAIPATGNLFAWVGSGGGSGNANGVFNFGQDSSFAGTKSSGSSNATDGNGIGDFYYTPPSGFLALATSSLPEPAIGPNSGVGENTDDYFNTVLYTGNGSTQSITVGFQPDWSWLKARNGAGSGRQHMLFDSVRGATKDLNSHNTSAEATVSTSLTSFDSGGFSLGSDSDVNTNAELFVSWNWKAGGTAVSNTDGSMTSQVSAAPDAGFSICTYTGTATVSESFGHGLNQAPELVITKARNTTNDWRVHGSFLGTNKFLSLSGTGAAPTDSSNGGFPDNTDTLVNLGYESTDGTNYVAYCFHSVDGFSKVGSYIGLSSATDGPFVNTGFSPALVIGRRVDGTGRWWMYDSARSPQMNYAKGTGTRLQANLPDPESTDDNANSILFLSNGFKVNSTNAEWNAGGSDFIFIAFAEAPFKYANAR